jgi:hypothetical protein
MGHFSGGCDEVLAFAGAGEVDTGAEGGGLAEAVAAGGGGDGSIRWVRCGGTLETGAAGGKAPFFLIKISQSNCFTCSSSISLESTSLLMKMI